MRYRMLDTNLLVMLDILLDRRNVTRTAEELGLSQPAVSTALGRLREHFQDELLIPVGRKNVLTPLAEQLKAPLKDVLARTDSLLSKRSGFDPSVDARGFSMVGSDYVTSLFGNDVLRSVALAGPKITVAVETMQQEMLDRFERAEIDLLVVPRRVALPDHPTTDLLEDRYVCAVWIDHPYIHDSISQKEYLEARHVIHRYRGGNRVTVLDQWFLDQSAIRRNVAVQVSSFSDILDMLPGTPFVGTVQRRLAEKMSRTLPIRILSAPFDFPVLPVVMQWHRNVDDPGLSWFRSQVQRVVSSIHS